MKTVGFLHDFTKFAQKLGERVHVSIELFK